MPVVTPPMMMYFRPVAAAVAPLKLEFSQAFTIPYRFARTLYPSSRPKHFITYLWIKMATFVRADSDWACVLHL
jgi:hypothetical protein